MTLEQKLAQLGQEAEKLRAKATDHPSRFTKADSDRATEVAAEHRRIKGMIDQQQTASQQLGHLANVPSPEQHEHPGEENGFGQVRQALERTGANTAALEKATSFGLETLKAFNEAGSVVGGPSSGKALASRGVITAAIPTTTKSSIPTYRTGVGDTTLSSMVGLPKRGMSMLEVIGAEETREPIGSYLRQTVRENNASTVPGGQKKPTSVYQFKAAEWRMVTIAHLTGPVRTQWLENYPGLLEFIESDMGYGIDRALNRFILFGGQSEDGSLEPGLLNTPGVQTVEFEDSKLVTLRNAIGELEDDGVQATHIVMSSADWKQVELQQLADGAFRFDAAPGDRASKQLWGLPVITPPELPAGRSLVGTFEATKVLHHGSHQIEWDDSAMGEGSEVYDNFARNMVRFRDEMQVALANQSLHAYQQVLLNEDVSSTPPEIDNPYPDVEYPNTPTAPAMGLIPAPPRSDNGDD